MDQLNEKENSAALLFLTKITNESESEIVSTKYRLRFFLEIQFEYFSLLSGYLKLKD